jgi:recombination protein RecT
MTGELAIIERNLQHVEPQLHRALAGAMPTPRLMQLILTACERSDKLMAAHPQTILNCAITAATLGLEPDGMTGQMFLLPFELKGRMVAQPCIGYRGYNSLAARRGCDMTITGEAVYEGDEFDYELGTSPMLRHRKGLGQRGRVVAAWAIAAAVNRPPIISVLTIDEINAVKAKSPGAKAKGPGAAFSPWNDAEVGFPAMASKTAKRRLSRCLPMITSAPQFMMAARMEEAHEEQGKASWIEPERGVIVDGEILEPSRTPTTADLIGSRPAADRSPPADADGVAGGEADAGPDSETLMRHDADLAAAAAQGTEALKAAYAALPADVEPMLRSAVNRRHKPAAIAADQKATELANGPGD